jgi:hypothetical protein
VKEDKYDKLFSQKGGSGFPYLACLDAGGLVVAKHAHQRSVEGFTQTLKNATAFVELRKKAEGGDKAAKVEHFIQALQLNHFTAEEGRKRAKGFTFGKVQTEKVESTLILLEMSEAEADATQDRTTWLPVGKKLNEMRKAGRVPSDTPMLQRFWLFLMEYAYSEKDAALFKQGLDVLKETKAAQKRITQEEKRLAELQEK